MTCVEVPPSPIAAQVSPSPPLVAYATSTWMTLRGAAARLLRESLAHGLHLLHNMAIEESDLGIAQPSTLGAAAPIGDDPPFNRLLVPLDGSSVAEAVLPYARRLAGGRGSHLILVQVVTPTPVAAALEAPAAAQIVAEADERARVEAHTYLERMSVRLQRDGREVTPLVLLGDPATVITNVAREHAVELIAMTTHGRTGLGRLMFGSVAEHVLRHAPVPVFLVRVADEAEARRAA